MKGLIKPKGFKSIDKSKRSNSNKLTGSVLPEPRLYKVYPSSRINVYTCDECNKSIATVDIDEGVTPFMIGCKTHTPGCRGTMKSHMYPKGVDPKYVTGGWIKGKYECLDLIPIKQPE